MRLAAWAAIALAAPVAGVSGAAHAQGSVAAEALFREGREAMRRGDVEIACRHFAESQRLEPAAGTLLNLGECSERLGRIASAWGAYTAAADQLADDRRAFAVERRDELARRVARVRLRRAAGAPAECSFHRGGEALGAVDDVPLPVDGGAATFELRCPGREPGTATATFVDGEERALVIAPGRPNAAERRPRSTVAAGDEHHATTPGVPGLLVASVVTGGLGVVALGASAVTGAFAIDRQGIVEDSCTRAADGALQCPPEGVNAADEGRTFATVSTTTFVAGALALAASATLLVVHLASSSEGEAEAAARIDAWLGPGDGGIRVHGAF